MADSDATPNHIRRVGFIQFSDRLLANLALHLVHTYQCEFERSLCNRRLLAEHFHALKIWQDLDVALQMPTDI